VLCKNGAGGPYDPLAFKVAGQLVLGFEQDSQLGDEREHATIAVVRRSGVEAHFSVLEVHLPPLHRQHLAEDAPSADHLHRSAPCPISTALTCTPTFAVVANNREGLEQLARYGSSRSAAG